MEGRGISSVSVLSPVLVAEPRLLAAVAAGDGDAARESISATLAASCLGSSKLKGPGEEVVIGVFRLGTCDADPPE